VPSANASVMPVRPPPNPGVHAPHRLKWHGELAALAIVSAVKAISLTWRVKFVDETEGVQGPIIFCLWHNRLALCMEAYHGFAAKRWPGRGLAALISASKDGALLARILKYFDVWPVRGSSSRRGRQALLELTTRIQGGTNVAITPDGPRGPKYQVQEGVIALAQVTGAAIVPVSATARWKWTVRSWDAFQVPLPFAACEIRMTKPLRVPREAGEAEREALRAELERRLLEITVD
jgi:lysophospholipid acyltransferase (LPLAT)-like uncharacterized protein